jgi:hypothetical protein
MTLNISVNTKVTWVYGGHGDLNFLIICVLPAWWLVVVGVPPCRQVRGAWAPEPPEPRSPSRPPWSLVAGQDGGRCCCCCCCGCCGELSPTEVIPWSWKKRLAAKHFPPYLLVVTEHERFVCYLSRGAVLTGSLSGVHPCATYDVPSCTDTEGVLDVWFILEGVRGVGVNDVTRWRTWS